MIDTIKHQMESPENIIAVQAMSNICADFLQRKYDRELEKEKSPEEFVKSFTEKGLGDKMLDRAIEKLMNLVDITKIQFVVDYGVANGVKSFLSRNREI